MAKISANGARELARFSKGDACLVLTSDGRVLGKYLKGDGFSVRKRIDVRNRMTADLVALVSWYATELGYTRVGRSSR